MEKPDEHAIVQETRAHSSSDLPRREWAASAGAMHTGAMHTVALSLRFSSQNPDSSPTTRKTLDKSQWRGDQQCT